LNEDLWSSEMTTKLGGIIFRKALMENNWSKVYESVVVGMIKHQEEEETDDEINVLKIFGDIGG